MRNAEKMYSEFEWTALMDKTIDREFVTSAKKIANFNEFSEIKKIVKIRKKNSLNARV